MRDKSIHRRRLGEGFTLAEILVVLTILGIATAIVVPRISGMGDLQVLSAGRTLLANMEYAQNEAIVSQRSITVAFDPDNNGYDLRYSDGSVLTHPVEKGPFQVRFASTAGAEKVDVLSADFNGAASVTFDALGAPDHDGRITLIADGHTATLTVAPVTGRMSLETATP